MQEIYWISRIGYLNTFCEVMIAVCIIGLLILPLFLLDDLFDLDLKTKKRYIKCYIAVFVISVLGAIFIPTKNDMILIYGLGSTIDYIKSNDKAKQLPDKALDALIKYVEGETKEK